MTPLALLWLALAGLVLALLAATGNKVLVEFSPHRLEAYCRLRKRPRLFDEILDQRDEVAVGAETAQIVGTVILILSSGLWLFGNGSASMPRLVELVAVVAAGTVVLLAVTSWIPWALVRLWAEPFLMRSWILWKINHRIFWPLTVGVRLVDVLLRRLADRHEEPEGDEEAFEDEIRTMVSAGEREGLLEADAREMIEGVIELGDVDVSEIMTPRSKVNALDVALSWPEIMEFVVAVGHTRIPVYERKLDKIIGILFVKDLLSELPDPSGMPQTPLRGLLRPAWFVPTTQPVDELLREFLKTRSHMAIVVDEYGAIAGVVTIEDALEEIVGEIVDETDQEEESPVVKLDDFTAESPGSTHLDELNEILHLELPEPEDVDTVAGLVISELGKIPEPGERIEVANVRITVLKASRRRVERVRLELLDQTSDKLATSE